MNTTNYVSFAELAGKNGQLIKILWTMDNIFSSRKKILKKHYSNIVEYFETTYEMPSDEQVAKDICKICDIQYDPSFLSDKTIINEYYVLSISKYQRSEAMKKLFLYAHLNICIKKLQILKSFFSKEPSVYITISKDDINEVYPNIGGREMLRTVLEDFRNYTLFNGLTSNFSNSCKIEDLEKEVGITLSFDNKCKK